MASSRSSGKSSWSLSSNSMGVRCAMHPSDSSELFFSSWLATASWRVMLSTRGCQSADHAARALRTILRAVHWESTSCKPLDSSRSSAKTCSGNSPRTNRRRSLAMRMLNLSSSEP